MTFLIINMKVLRKIGLKGSNTFHSVKNMATKSFFEKPSTQKALVISFMVALILIAIEAIRYVIEVIIDIVFYGYTIDTVIDSYSYLFGIVVAIIILILFLVKYREVLEK